MNRERIVTESRDHWLQLRRQDITSTEASALFGLSPYQSYYELWHRKRNLLDDSFETNERMEWGLKLEKLIAMTLCERRGWPEPVPFDIYMRLPDHRLGSSFDYEVTDGDAIDGSAILECKNVDGLVFKQKWHEGEPPAHIELQIQHQMLVSGFDRCHLAVLVGGNELHHVERKADPEVHERILERAAEFWAMEIAPEPDMDVDAGVVGQLYSHAEPGSVLEVDEGSAVDDLVQNYLDLKATEKTCKKELDQVKAELLMMIGDAEKVIGEGWSISAGVVGPKVVPEYEKKGYRNFRVSRRKS